MIVMYVELNIPFSAPRIAEREEFNSEMEWQGGPSARSSFLFNQTCGSILDDINDLIDRSCDQCTSLPGALGLCKSCTGQFHPPPPPVSCVTNAGVAFRLVLSLWPELTSGAGGRNVAPSCCSGIVERVKDLDLFVLHYMN